MPRRLRAIARALALILFGTGVAIVALELGMRLAGVGGRAELGPEYDRPVVGYVPHPDRRLRAPAEDDSVLRVAVIGDSFTAGFGVEWYDTYPNRLEHLLNLNPEAPPAQVETFARNDTTTWQQLRLLDQAMARRPDVVILGVFLNDTEDPSDRQLARYRDALAPRVPTGLALDLLRASRIAAWLHLRSEQLRSYRAALELQDYVFDPEYRGFQRFEKAVRAFAKTCRDNEAELVAVVWPSMGGLGPHYPHRLAHERIGEVLGRARIPTLDLLGEFTDKSTARLAIYPGVDNHPNEIAHRIAAAAIFRFLVGQRIVDRRYEVRRRATQPPNYWRRRVQRQLSPLFVEGRAGGGQETEE